ncbi:unnamed protein product [Urochloa humidicola]
MLAVAPSFNSGSGWMTFTHHDAEAGSSSAAPTPPATAAARRGARPLYTDSTAAGRAPVAPTAPPAPVAPVVSPPAPATPPAPTPLPRVIPTGHRQVPNGLGPDLAGADDGGDLPSSDEGEA